MCNLLSCNSEHSRTHCTPTFEMRGSSPILTCQTEGSATEATWCRTERTETRVYNRQSDRSKSLNRSKAIYHILSTNTTVNKTQIKDSFMQGSLPTVKQLWISLTVVLLSTDSHWIVKCDNEPLHHPCTWPAYLPTQLPNALHIWTSCMRCTIKDRDNVGTQKC